MSHVIRVSPKLGQAYNLAIRRNRLSSDNKPDIRKLSEKDNVRQGFFERPEFLLIKPALPEYLQDFAHFGYVTGMRSGEIKSLEWSRTDSDTIRLRGVDAKTGKPRSVPLEGEIAEVIERRRAVAKGRWIFHLDGEQIGDFRKAWQRACVLTGLGAFYCRECDVKLDARCPVPKVRVEMGRARRRPSLSRKVVSRLPPHRSQGYAPARRESRCYPLDHRTRDAVDALAHNITDDRDQRAALRIMHAHRQEQDRASKRVN